MGALLPVPNLVMSFRSLGVRRVSVCSGHLNLNPPWSSRGFLTHRMADNRLCLEQGGCLPHCLPLCFLSAASALTLARGGGWGKGLPATSSLP